jgi:hypothetical protein
MSQALLRPFGPNIWLADGAHAQVAGFRYPTRMAVIRLEDGGLLIWSPVALGDELAGQLAALGVVHHLVAPNSLHHLYLGAWQAAYPAARLHAAPGLAAKRPDLRIDVELADAPPGDWPADIDYVLMRGNTITTEAVFFHRSSGTVLFTDLIQQFPPGWFTGWRAVIARLDLMTEAEPAVPRKFRVAFTDRRAGRAALSRILDWPSDKVVMAHGTPVEQDGRAFISSAFGWLAR